MRWLLGVSIATATAHADPDWRRCTEEEMKFQTEGEREITASLLHGQTAAGYETWEKFARTDTVPLHDMLLIALQANDQHEPKQVAHIASAMEEMVATDPHPWVHADAEHEGYLAQVQVVAGNGALAKQHLANGEAIIAKEKDPIYTEYIQVWAAAIVMQDDAARARLQKAYLATSDGKKELYAEAKYMASQGAGWGLLAAADTLGADQKKEVLEEVLAGLEERKDYVLGAAVAARLAPTPRLHAVASLGQNSLVEELPPIVGAIRAAIPVARRADDSARADLIAAAVHVGLAKDVQALAATFRNPWQRANQEAVIATGLALHDKPAAIALVHAALARIQTKPRTQADKDYASNTRFFAATALARSGLAEEAALYTEKVSPSDLMISFRDDPKALAAWWAAADADARSTIMLYAALGDPDDQKYFAPFCKY